MFIMFSLKENHVFITGSIFYNPLLLVFSMCFPLKNVAKFLMFLMSEKLWETVNVSDFLLNEEKSCIPGT